MDHVIFDRRSIRKYRAQIPDRGLVEQVLLAGRAAPSGKNRQPWKFYVYGGEPKRNLLAAMQAGLVSRISDVQHSQPVRAGLADAVNTLRIMRSAPILIMVVNPEGADPMAALDAHLHVQELVDTLSVGAAFENMLLMAHTLGLGTLWIANTFFAYPELMQTLTSDGTLLGAIALGYADEAPAPRPRRPLDEIVEYRL